MSRTLIQFLFAQLPQLVHIRCTTSHCTLGDLDGTSHGCPRHDGVCCRLCLHLDDSDSGIFGPTVVGTVLEIAQPGLEGWRVVFADGFTVCDDIGLATDACPFSRRVEEGDVDFGVGIQIVGLAGFGVRVE